jgi:multidrug efflux pump subunit AcrA (membrane-fusion protein)
MTAVLKIANYSKSNSIAIPVNAVQRSDTSTFVFVIGQNNTVKKQSVRVGATYGGKAEILSGLTSGEQIVTEGASEIEDGDKVRVLTQSN